MTFIKKTTSRLPSLRSLGWGLGFYLPVAILCVGAALATWRYTGQLNDALVNGQRTTGVAARIGTLGEQVSKAMLLVEKSSRDRTETQQPVYELQIASDRLDQLINAFNEGSETVAPDGVRFMVEMVEDPEALGVLHEMNVIWVGIKTRADAVVLAAGPKKEVTEAMAFTPEALSEASSFVFAQQSRLAETSLAFGRRLEAMQADKILAAERPRNIWLVTAIVTALALPGVFVFNRVRRARDQSARLAAELGANKTELERQTRELAGAKAETDRIMDTIQEGLMLVDEKGVIGAQHSRELVAIFRSERLAGANLLHLLQRLLSEKMYKTTKDYFELLFDIRRKEKAVLKVNPLSEIEVSFPNPEGGFLHRYLGFSFRRIVNGDRVDRVFVAVRDITTQVELEKRLRDSEKLKERQLEILLNIVHASSDDLGSFAELAGRELDAINAALRAEDFASPTPERQKALHERLSAVFRAVHNIKGNAAFLRLEYFHTAADSCETKVSELPHRPSLKGDDCLPLVVAPAGLRGDLGDLIELRAKLAGLRGDQPAAARKTDDGDTAPAEDTLTIGLQKLASELADEMGKEVDFQIDAHAVRAVSAFRQDLVRDVLIQLVRNSLAHGVEKPAEREAAGKPRRALLTLRAAPRVEDGLVGLALRDDGRGLDFDGIRVKALTSGLIAFGSGADDAEVARCIFAPGFSTSLGTDLHSGRGVGLDILKTRIVDEIGGLIEVKAAPGLFCEFAFHLPEIPEPAA